MLNILPYSILQAWGLWGDFDGAHAEEHAEENTLAGVGEAMDTRPSTPDDALGGQILVRPAQWHRVGVLNNRGEVMTAEDWAAVSTFPDIRPVVEESEPQVQRSDLL